MSRSFFETTTKGFAEGISSALKASLEYIQSHPELDERLYNIYGFGSHTLSDGIPSFWDILRKVGYFPFAEAATDLEYAINHAMAGAYKSAYFNLRSFFELVFIGLYFISSAATHEEAREWMGGVSGTPFLSRSLDKLLKLPEYAEAESYIGLKSFVKSIYGSISDRTHTRGQGHGHMKLNLSNRPRFVEKSLIDFIDTAFRCCESLAIILAIQHPVVLIPLPMTEKFGLNPPASGFLEEFDVQRLKSFIPARKLQWLENNAENDEGTQDLCRWVFSHPDIAEDELAEQAKWHREFFSIRSNNDN